MKPYAKLTLLFLVFVFQAPFTFASGIFTTPGTRACSLGAAYIGIADDITAIYWNPAGLSQLQGKAFEVSALFADTQAKSNKSLSNVASPNPYDGDFPIKNLYDSLGGEPNEYNSKELKLKAIVPFIGGYTRVKDITIAAGVYALGGGGGNWESTVNGSLSANDTITASAERQKAFVLANISASKEVNEKLFIGVGIDTVGMIDHLKISKEYTKSASSPLASYLAMIEQQSTGSNYQIVFGGMYKPTGKVRLGLVFRSGTVIQLSGKARTVTKGISAITSGAVPDLDFDTNYRQNYTFPMTYGLGVSYEPKNSLLFAFSVEQNKYSTLRNAVTFDNELAGIFTNSNTDMQWKDTYQVHFGTEYRLNEKWALRAGVQNDPSPVNNDYRTLLDTNQYERIYITLGAGYKIKSMTIDCFVSSNYSNNITRNTKEYEFNSNSVRLAFGYKL
ncbi:MAG: outer membrane protein transport protein [Elusimicrobia bacterium]|nr:outer membrane protein transport protein [Candidatus Liberimonas magnetica]